MEPNTARAEAERWLGIAAKLLAARDLVGSKTFAIRAREADPANPISDQILAVVDTLVAAEKRVISSTHYDWYSILQLAHLARDPELISDQYRRLVLLLNPDHNRFPFADFALRLVVDAWSVLSDPTKKWIYDSELSLFLQRSSASASAAEPVRVDSAATYQFFQQPPPEQPQPHPQEWIHHLHQQEQQQPQLQERQLFQQQLHPQPPPQPPPQPQWLPQSQPPPQPPPQPQWLPQSQSQPPPQTPPQPQWLPQPQPHPQPPQRPPEQHRPPPQPKEPQIPPQLQQQQQEPGPPPPPPVLTQPPPQQQQRERNNGKKEDGIGRASNVANERGTDKGNKNDCNDNNDDNGVDDDDGQIDSFWTACPYCYYIYEYPKTFQECALRCQNCRRGFHALEIPNPPTCSGKEGSFCSWACFPVGFSMTSWKKSVPFGGDAKGFGSNWVPFSPMFACPVKVLKKKVGRNLDDGDEEFIVSVLSEDSDSSDDWASTGKRKKQESVRSRRGRVGRKSNAEREKMANQNSVGAAGGADRENPQRVAEMQRSVNHEVGGTKNDVINKAGGSGSLRKQMGKGVRGRKKLDLNVEFSNEVEDHAATVSTGNGEEVVEFFEGLDEFLSTLPILHVVGDDKAKPS